MVPVFLLIYVVAYGSKLLYCSAADAPAPAGSEFLDPDAFPELFGDPHQVWASRITTEGKEEEEDDDEASASAPSPDFLSSEWGMPPPPDGCELKVLIDDKMTVSMKVFWAPCDFANYIVRRRNVLLTNKRSVGGRI
jgi:hypothetical protein